MKEIVYMYVTSFSSTHDTRYKYSYMSSVATRLNRIKGYETLLTVSVNPCCLNNIVKRNSETLTNVVLITDEHKISLCFVD
jgi:hypothetical protein